jgi:hypothetical protein
MSSPRALSPGFGLDLANGFFANLGAPALAVANRFVASANMKVGAYTVANASPADGLARNVTVTHTQVGGVTDTLGTIVVVGTDIHGNALTETITPISASVASGLKCFKTVTSVTGAGWVINTGNDTIVVGFGNKIGLSNAIRRKPAVAAATQIPLAYLGATALVPVVAFSATDLSQCNVDASAGTYDATKRLFALVIR